MLRLGMSIRRFLIAGYETRMTTALAVLNPRNSYVGYPNQDMYRSLRDAFERKTDIESAVQALQEVEVFRQKHGEFGSEMAARMAVDPKTSPSSWWMMFGGSTPQLHRLALRLVSQCCSSSGCERNWSTFALLHTKVRNRLTHKKLTKLVYVNYNLRLRLNEVSGGYQRDDSDFVDQLAHLSFYDHRNPVRE